MDLQGCLDGIVIWVAVFMDDERADPQHRGLSHSCTHCTISFIPFVSHDLD